MELRWVSLVGASLLLACAEATDRSAAEDAKDGGDVDAAVDAGSVAGGPPVTYHGEIRALLEANCVSCHVKGGIGPMPLDELESVSEVRELVVAAVSAGIMPPWPASADCRELRDVRALTEEQVALLERWKQGGFLDGDEDDYLRPKEVFVAAPEGDPSVVLMAADAYTPNPAITDEYRCFVTEGTFEEDTYLTGMDIRPGVREEVHHVQVHKISVDQLAAVVGLDDAAEGAGYPCAGGAGLGIMSVNMFSWRPGSAAVVFEEGDAALIEAGSAFVLQVHYNTQFLPEAGPQPDRSAVAFWTLPGGSLPERIVTRRGVFGPVGPGGIRAVIPAGQSQVVGETTQTMTQLNLVNGVYVQGEIIGMTPHMHRLGTRLTATLSRAGEPECMIDVPNWDAEWQLDYSYREPVAYESADTLTVRCEYDNSPENQPILDGVPLAPRDVGWGEGSLDEMCLNYVWFRYDRDPFLAAYMP